jgi:hypothetical protein
MVAPPDGLLASYLGYDQVSMCFQSTGLTLMTIQERFFVHTLCQVRSVMKVKYGIGKLSRQ